MRVTSMQTFFSLLMMAGALGLPASQPSSHTPHKVCVPYSALQACEKMVAEGKTIKVEMSCVPARDRLDCLSKLKDHKADFEAVEPEDMYVASQLSGEEFAVFKEIRTKEEPQAEFRYDAVAVVHKDLRVDSIQDLKGLGSCHTGIGRNVGYKIPITKLTKMGVLGPLSDTSVSPRENELKALSKFFSKACLVGKWSPHPDTNRKLKERYSNLCDLCEKPELCDYPDVNSGYEGALRCLAKAGGQVAWTKVIFVKKFFGMAYGSVPAKESEYNPNEYSYLCPDGRKEPITGPPCTWASRPWPAYLSNQHTSPEYMELRDEIGKLNDLGESEHADWLASVLGLSNKTVAVDNNGPYSPINYLEKAKYVDVLERDVLAPRRVVRLCVSSSEEKRKCETLKLASYSRDVRPSITCLFEDSQELCLQAVDKGQAEIIILDPHQAATALEKYKLKPLVVEKYGNTSDQRMVGVVGKDSPIGNLAGIAGKKLCIEPNSQAGYYGALETLLEAGVVAKNHCPYEYALSESFKSVEYSEDPLDCLQSGKGDVAFLTDSTLHKTNLPLQVLCTDGKKSLSESDQCKFSSVPPKMVLSSEKLNPVQQEDVLYTLLGVGDVFSKRPDVFLLFGNYQDKPNVLFSNHATGLEAAPSDFTTLKSYTKLVKNLSICQPSS